ncbi:MAG: glycosyltransferase [Candidatus Methanomethylicia archaeon]
MIFEENLKKRYDLIHAFWAYPAGFAAMLVKRLIKVPITISVLGYDIDEHTLNNPLLKEITTFTLREADHIIIGAKNHYFNVLLLGIPKHKITILSMPVPTEKFSPHINRKIVRELYGIKDYEILVGFGPRISKFYGAIDFIKAALLSSKKASNIIFMILGENTIGKPLEDYLKRNNVKIIFTGEIPYDNMPYYYAAMDIYCNLCYGGQGISTLEAMSSKKLVIGYNIGDIKITNEVDGILVQPGNIKQLAEKILTAAKNKDLREKIAENARKRVLAHNNMSTYIDKLVYIYMKFRISK